MTEALIWVREAFAGYTRGEMICPQRLPLPLSPPGAVLLSMPAYDGHRYAGVKLVGVQPENAARHLPTVRANYLLFDGETLELLALMAASRLTAIRTGAAGGLAASLLALPEARTLALIGAGAQAETQLLAALAVRPIQQVWVTSASLQETAAFIERMRERTTVPMRVASSSAEALAQASLVVTATNSLLPVFEDRALQPGAHVTAIGAFTTAMQEVPDETMARAAVYVDGAEAAWSECGELAGAFARGAIARDHVRGEIGALLEGRIAGREDARQITVFKSVGLAAQDLACAAAVYRRARESGVGTVVSQ
jgi:ornithine cyclodeaminase/alanine dehydrogenase-like protein (mu-crystallin family)